MLQNHNHLNVISCYIAPVFTRQISTPASPRKTKFADHAQHFPNSTSDAVSIYSSPSMLSLHSVMDGGSSRMESEKGRVREGGREWGGGGGGVRAI